MFLDYDEGTNNVFGKGHHSLEQTNQLGFGFECDDHIVAVSHFVYFVGESFATFLVGRLDGAALCFDVIFNGGNCAIHCFFVQIWSDDEHGLI